MGLSNRDYYRDDEGNGGWSDSYSSGGRGPGWLQDAPASRLILGITIALFVIGLILTRRTPFGVESLITEWGNLNLPDLYSGQIWRLVTYGFLHDRYDLWHLIVNMLLLWFFGAHLETLYGTREFTTFYFTAILSGALGLVIWDQFVPVNARVIGASGACLALFGLYACHYPRQQVYFMGLIPMEIRWMFALFLAGDIYLALMALSGEMAGGGKAYFVHLAGALFAWLYFRSGLRLSQGLPDLRSWSLGWKRWRASSRLRVHREDDPVDDLDAEQDRILAKIHQQGTASLTPREQAFMAKAAERAKRRLNQK